MRNRKFIVAAAFVVVCLFASIDLVRASSSNLTPLPGTPLRKAVLDALRMEVKRLHGLDVLFVVKHLKVKEDWAWAHTLPRSLEGSNRYEDISALLKLNDGKWSVAEIPCGEVENPDCLNGPEYFVGLQKRFPGVPAEIIPEWAPESRENAY